MKIILATPMVPPEIGGPATYVKELAERLAGAHEVTVVAYASTAEHLPHVRLRTVSKQRPLPVRLLKYFLVLLSESKGADIIYVQNAVASGLPAALVGRMRGIPVVLKFVGDEAWERATLAHRTEKRLEDFLEAPEGGLKIRIIMWLQGLVLRNVTRVTTPSQYLRDAIVRTYSIEPAHAVVNYNAAEEAETAPFMPERNPYQLFTSARMVAWKGVDGILRAVALLAPRYPSLSLVIAGDGPELAQYKALAAELAISDRITFLGRVARTETWHLRKSSSIYILNSTYEGLPHTVLTSFAAGIPVIATDIPGTNEAVYHEKTGLLVPVGDDRALADAIARLLDDPALARALTTQASSLLAEKFSWPAHTDALLALFASIVRPRR